MGCHVLAAKGGGLSSQREAHHCLGILERPDDGGPSTQLSSEQPL